MAGTLDKAALKAAILADTDPLVIAARTIGDCIKLAQLYNADASPTTLAWINAVPADIVDEASDWPSFDSIAPGKRDSWGFFLARTRDFGRAKVRKWITDVWGAATAGSNAEKILQAGTEKASKAEVVMGGTVKTTDNVSALDRNWSGDLQWQDVAAALNS